MQDMNISPIIKALNAAVNTRTAIAALNAPGFDAMTGMGRAARDLGCPIIVQVSARLIRRHGAATVRTWFDAARRNTDGEIYLHLDHCQDEAVLDACITQGWDMIMFDGSQLPIDENCRLSAEIVRRAHASGTAVEGEVGPIGGEEDGHEASANVASPDDIRRLSDETGIDCIAVGFGNVHGDYSSKAHLRWDVYEAAQAISGLPLVLHGGSGLSDDEFRRAIRAGSAKINISTDLKKAYSAVLREPEVHATVLRDPGCIHDLLEQAAYEVAQRYSRLFSTPVLEIARDLDH